MAEILVRLVDGTCEDSHANPLRGMPVCVQPDGHTWGNAECEPEYIVVKVPGVEPTEIRDYCQPCPIPQARPMLPRRRKYTLANAIIDTRRCSRPFPSISVENEKRQWRRRRYRVSNELIAIAKSQSKENITIAELTKGLSDLTKA